MNNNLHPPKLYNKGRFFIFLILLVCLNNSKAQTVSNYYNFTSQTGTYVPAPQSQVLGIPAQDDDSYSGLDLGFTFNYRGVSYNQISVNTNGFIRMGSTVFSSYNPISDQNQIDVIS